MINRIKESRAFYIVLSILIAVALWLYVSNVENPDGDKIIRDIPVIFLDDEGILEERNLIVVEGSKQTITLTVQGKRNALTKLDKDNIYITVNLSGITTPGIQSLAYDITFPNTVIGDSIKIVERSNYIVNITVGRLSSKEVAVHGLFTGSVAEGYIAEDFIFSPSTIEITGEEGLVNSVDYALINVSSQDITETMSESLSYSLIGYNGMPVMMSELLWADITEIWVTLPITVHKTVPLDVDFIAGGGATKANVSYKIFPDSVVLSGDADDLTAYNTIVLGSIDLATVINTANVTFTIPLSSAVTNLSGVTEATVSVTIKGLSSKTLDVTDIELINVSEGITATAVTQSLTVLVRGPEETVNLILPYHLRVVADLKDLEAKGTHHVPVKIYLDSNSDAGIVGENYKIAVEIQ